MRACIHSWSLSVGSTVRSLSTTGKAICRLLWIDALWIAAVALAMGGLYLVPPHRRGSRLFPLWHGPDGRIVGPSDISYPYVEEILTSLYAAIACLLVPIALVLVVQLRVKSIWDFCAGVLGLLKALVAAFVSLPVPFLPLSCLYPASILSLSCLYPVSILSLSCLYPVSILSLSCLSPVHRSLPSPSLCLEGQVDCVLLPLHPR
jgi:hypothetical protein